MNRQVLSWCLFDFANSSYSAVIAAVVFPVYYTQTVVGNEAGQGDLWWGRAIAGYSRSEPFWLLAAQGLRDFHERLKVPFGTWAEAPAGLMQVWEMALDAADQAAFGELVVKSAPVNHIPMSLAYRLEAEGRSLVYSGDTDESEALVELAAGADLLVLECAMPHKVPGHLTPAEAGRIAARAGVKRLLLTHFYPPCDEVDVVALAGREFAGEIIRAEDDLRVRV